MSAKGPALADVPRDSELCEKPDCPWRHSRHFHVLFAGRRWVLAPGQLIW